MKQKDLKKQADRVFHKLGDAIRGEKITAQFRKMHRTKLVHGTSADQIMQSKLEGSVFCVIDKPLGYLRKK